jgi:predicted xylose isomerase-like sugar epimerase
VSEAELLLQSLALMEASYNRDDEGIRALILGPDNDDEGARLVRLIDLVTSLVALADYLLASRAEELSSTIDEQMASLRAYAIACLGDEDE